MVKLIMTILLMHRIFFESWLTHINAKVIKQTLSQSEVQLSLGEKDLLNEYKVELNHESCWKINSVQPVS